MVIFLKVSKTFCFEVVSTYNKFSDAYLGLKQIPVLT